MDVRKNKYSTDSLERHIKPLVGTAVAGIRQNRGVVFPTPAIDVHTIPDGTNRPFLHWHSIYCSSKKLRKRPRKIDCSRVSSSGSNHKQTMSLTIQQRIQALPQELQDLIGEYNAEHRDHTRKLHTEYFAIIYKTCCVCRETATAEYYWSTDYFLYTKYGLDNYWCSQECFSAEQDEERIGQYLRVITDYIQRKSVLYTEVETGITELNLDN